MAVNRDLVSIVAQAEALRLASTVAAITVFVTPIRKQTFVDAFNTGHHLYSLRSNVNRTSNAIDANRRELDRIENRIIANGVEMISDETTQTQRVYLLKELKDLSERNRRAGSGA